ncbi:MAG: IPT/TIG domain-containing protein, partial [Planctomycetota bacterium]
MALGLCSSVSAQSAFRIDAIVPSVHPAVGGSLARVEGAGFSEVVNLEIGGELVRSATFVDDGTCLVVLPALPPGWHDVVLRHPERLPVTIPNGVRTTGARFAGVDQLRCERFLNGQGQEVRLTWEPRVEFDGFEVFREDDLIANLPGTTTELSDEEFEAEDPRVRYAVFGYFERDGQREYSHAASCVAVDEKPIESLVKFATYRPSGRRIALQSPEGKASRGNFAEAVFEVQRPVAGVRIAVHARRLDEIAELHGMVVELESGEIVCDDIVFEETEVSFDARWIDARCEEPLDSGRYGLRIFVPRNANDGNTAYSLSVDATSYRHADVCGPYPLVRVQPPEDREDVLVIESVIQRSVRRYPGSEPRTDGKIDLALRADTASPREFDYFLWKFSDGSQAETSGPEITAALPRGQVASVSVCGFDAEGLAARTDVAILTALPDLPKAKAEVAGNQEGLDPDNIEIVCLDPWLRDYDFLSGKTRGIAIPYMAAADAHNGRQIRRITLEIVEGADTVRDRVDLDLVFNLQNDDGNYRGVGFISHPLPRVEAPYMRYRFIFEDSGGNTSRSADRWEMCQLPPPFNRDWMRTVITGDVQSGFTVEGIWPRGGPLWREDFTIPVVRTNLVNKFNLNLSAKLGFREGNWSKERLDGEVEAKILSVPVIETTDFSIVPPATPEVSCAVTELLFNRDSISLYDGPRMCVPIVPEWIWVFPIGPVPVVTVEFGMDACVEFDVNAAIELDIGEDPGFRTTITPEITASLPTELTASVLLGLASLGVTVTPALGLQLPITINSQNVDDPRVDWCASLSVHGKAKGCLFSFLDFLVEDLICYSRSDFILDPVEFGGGCGAARVAGGVEEVKEIDPPTPSIASSSSGETGMAVWLATGVDGGPPRLMYRLRSGAGEFGAARPMFPPAFDAYVQDPSVAVLDDDTAVAVWTENRLQPGDVPEDVTEQELWNLAFGARDIAYSIWDGERWSPRRFVESNDDPDGMAVVERADDRRAIVCWVGSDSQMLRGDGSVDFESFDIHSAFIRENGSVVGRTVLSADESGAKASDTEPAVAFSPNGVRGLAVWVRDLDGDMTTPSDRFFVTSTFRDGSWSEAEVLTDPSEMPGVVQPTVTLVREEFGAVAGVLPVEREAVPLFHTDSRIFAIPLRGGNFGEARFLPQPNATGSGSRCTFEEGLTGFEPSLAPLNGSTVALGFRASGATANASTESLTAAGVATLNLVLPPAQAEWSPMTAVASPAEGIGSFEMACGSEGTLDLLMPRVGIPGVAITNTMTGGDVAIADILFDNPVESFGVNVSGVAVIENHGLLPSPSQPLVVGVVIEEGFREVGTEIIPEIQPGQQELIEISLFLPREASAIAVRAPASPSDPDDANNRRTLRLGVAAPLNLACSEIDDPETPNQMLLRWENSDPYEEIFVYR